MVIKYGVSDYLLNEWKEWKNIIFICLAVNIVTYGLYIFNMTYAVDDYMHIFKPVNVMISGRWCVDFFHNTICQTSYLPVLGPLLCIFCNILVGIGLCKLWSTQGRVSLVVVLLWSCHPYLMDIYNFRIIAPIFSIGFLVSIVAMHVAIQGKSGFIVSILLMYLCLSIYQPVLGVVVAAMMIQVLLGVLRESFSKESFKQGCVLFLRYVLMLCFSVAVYLVVTKLINAAFDINVSSRFETCFTSTFEQIKAKICVTMVMLIVRLGPIREFVLPFVGKLAIFIITLLSVLEIIKRKTSFAKRLAMLVWVCLIPFGAVSFYLLLMTLEVPWRICMGFVVFWTGMFVVCQESRYTFIRNTSFVLSVFLVVFFAVNNNTLQYKQMLTNQNDFVMGNRIMCRMQSLDGYKPNMELAIVGRVEREIFSQKGKSDYEIFKEYLNHSQTRRYSLAASVFESDWGLYSYFFNYLNLELKMASKDSFLKAVKTSQEIEPWPNPSSVFIIDNTVVVKLGDK